ncbi:MAG: RHS repeat protein, partial [Desulfobacteraceae bacterium]|nr:RHS repeat protein [Desulfobacteraceae bacterium]
DPGTGFLTAKKDAKNKSVSYGYTPWGKLETRTWARENGTIVTTYIYDSDTAELRNINYTDPATDSIEFTYDRLGRRKSITDAVGTRTSEYDPDTLELNSVSMAQDASFSASGLYNRTVTRKHDTYGRPAGFSMGSGYDVTYGYEPATGRFRSLSHDIAGSHRTTAYYYVPKSDLIGRVESGSG